MDQTTTVHYLPILTTLLSLIFGSVLINAARTRKSGPHLWWWAFGVFCYGLGTGFESVITLAGNTVFLNKGWYIAGALLGGWPLAQGAVYLHMKRKKANVLSYITIAFIIVASILVVASPVNLAQLELHRPTGAILGWSWVRLLTPIINIYAFVFLVGGAIMSALYFKRSGGAVERVWGNVSIALGGLLPGIGGTMAKAGQVEALYVLELVGLVFIWIGYGVIARSKSGTKSTAELAAARA